MMAGYFERNGRLKMPAGGGARDVVGIRWCGQVAREGYTVAQRRAGEDREAGMRETLGVPVRAGSGERYERVEDYDPVLKDSCRLK